MQALIKSPTSQWVLVWSFHSINYWSQMIDQHYPSIQYSNLETWQLPWKCLKMNTIVSYRMISIQMDILNGFISKSNLILQRRRPSRSTLLIFTKASHYTSMEWEYWVLMSQRNKLHQVRPQHPSHYQNGSDQDLTFATFKIDSQMSSAQMVYFKFNLPMNLM